MCPAGVTPIGAATTGDIQEGVTPGEAARESTRGPGATIWKPAPYYIPVDGPVGNCFPPPPVPWPWPPEFEVPPDDPWNWPPGEKPDPDPDPDPDDEWPDTPLPEPTGPLILWTVGISYAKANPLIIPMWDNLYNTAFITSGTGSRHRVDKRDGQGFDPVGQPIDHAVGAVYYIAEILGGATITSASMTAFLATPSTDLVLYNSYEEYLSLFGGDRAALIDYLENQSIPALKSGDSFDKFREGTYLVLVQHGSLFQGTTFVDRIGNLTIELSDGTSYHMIHRWAIQKQAVELQERGPDYVLFNPDNMTVGNIDLYETSIPDPPYPAQELGFCWSALTEDGDSQHTAGLGGTPSRSAMFYGIRIDGYEASITTLPALGLSFEKEMFLGGDTYPPGLAGDALDLCIQWLYEEWMPGDPSLYEVSQTFPEEENVTYGQIISQGELTRIWHLYQQVYIGPVVQQEEPYVEFDVPAIPLRRDSAEGVTVIQEAISVPYTLVEDSTYTAIGRGEIPGKFATIKMGVAFDFFNGYVFNTIYPNF